MYLKVKRVEVKNMQQRSQAEVQLLLNEMKIYIRDFLKDNYNLNLAIAIKHNKRLSRAQGRFIYIRQFQRDLNKHKNVASAIEFNYKLLEYADKDIIKGVARHEAIHYALFEKNLPFSDGSPTFKYECMKHRAPLHANPDDVVKTVYNCTNKDEHCELKVSIPLRGCYVCKKHKAKLEKVGYAM